MAIEITINGHRLPVKSVEYTIDKDMVDDVPEFIDLSLAQQAEVTLTLNNDYYRVMALARLLDTHSPKKAKQLRKRFEHINPLRKMGLL